MENRFDIMMHSKHFIEPVNVGTQSQDVATLYRQREYPPTLPVVVLVIVNLFHGVHGEVLAHTLACGQ